MTTRGRLNRRFFGGLVGLGATFLVLELLQSGDFGETVGGVTLREAGLLAIVGVGYYWWSTACLSCHKALKWFALSWRAARTTTSPRCPYCGVSIDHDTTRDSKAEK